MSQSGEENSRHDLLDEEKTDDAQSVRASSRKRTLTEKGQEMHDQEAIKNKKAFIKKYDAWKEMAKMARTELKSFCSEDELVQLKQNVQTKHTAVSDCYERIQRNRTATPDIVPKMDACIQLTAEICEIVQKRLNTLGDAFNGPSEKEQIRIILSKDEHKSIFGDSNTETVISESRCSNHSKASSKYAEAEAELAARQEKAKAVQVIHAQEEVLSRLEKEKQRLEQEKQAALKRIEAEMQEEKKRLQLLQAETEVKIAEARVNAYQSFENDAKSWFNDIEHKSKAQSQPNPPVKPYVPSQTKMQSPQIEANAQASQNNDGLTQAIMATINMNRLPVPEPPKFAGEPLKYLDWKMSFMAMIDRQPLPAHEKMFYLKTYLIGEARKAVEGFFYRNSEEAYQGALKVLEERYGNAFIIQRAFRDKLMKWPKVSTNDPAALRQFADFLQGCVEAQPHVKGLAILDDCEENHKLLKKLPDWVVRRWSRLVTKTLDESGDYPSFSRFTDFIQTEARIACNPIASPLLIKTDERQQRAKAFHTNTRTNFNNVETPSSYKSKSPCPICNDETHGVARCQTFAEKSAEDKRTLIRENNLCFGCLKKGHSSKNCKTRHICGKCNRRHPTCLHEEREKRFAEAPENHYTSTDHNGRQPDIKVTSHAVMQYASATSNIVPVYMSSAKEPEKEVLTYALLDTQSDSTFILEDLLEELNVETTPVQLKLSTMTAVDTVIASKGVDGLQVRGLNSEKNIHLRRAYTRDFIPVDRSYIPTSKTASQWPHLKHLANKLPPLKECNVGLLIGSDCPLALAPLEVVTGGENDPFAQRTELGWSIVGSSNPHLDRQGNQRFVHRVKVREIPTPSTTDVLKILESDFNERKYADKDKYVSQDDVRFIQLE